MSRRDSQDPQWKKLKKDVHLRDKEICRLLRILSAREAIFLKSKAPRVQLGILDVAHVFPVGRYPHMVYDVDNVVLLNRFSHESLDSMRSPITGDPISKEERDLWWIKIAGETNYKALKERAEGRTDE